jgi:hypothetical protein
MVDKEQDEMQTVISVFENRQTAQRALDRLLQTGFDSNRVHRHEAAAPANTAAAGSPGSADKGDFDEDRGVLSSIGHFFASVFGQDPPTGYADKYVQKARRGHYMVVVQAKDEEEKDRATTIVRELGAIDIAEDAPEWRDGA